MKIYFAISIILIGLVSLVLSCNHSNSSQAGDLFSDFIPSYIKDSVYLSTENFFSKEKADLGHYLFYDRRLSFNQTRSCASCHDPKFSFTDSYRRSAGALGDNLQHNAPPLINLVFNKYLTLSDSSLHFPEQQINNPMFHQEPIEMGWAGNEAAIIKRLRKDEFYSGRMKLVFPGAGDPFTIKNIQFAIACFIKTIFSFNSVYDRYRKTGNAALLSASELRGMDLFFSNSVACNRCHSGINFSEPVITDSNGRKAYYQNTGLYNLGGKGMYPAYDQGLIEYSRNPKDMGKYRVPTLRNLSFTAPYFHDGSAATLDEVISVYEMGGRNIISGDCAGDGRKNPCKSNLINGIRLTSQEKNDLIHFLVSLSDSSVCKNPLYANPFKQDETKN
jgi:cytochrome c peroxidase